MQDFRIKDVDRETTGDLVEICVPPERKDESAFIEGMEVKRRWVVRALQRFGCVAKLAYAGDVPVGMIQYVPSPEEQVVEIICVFIPEKQHLRKGLGRALVENLIKDMGEPHPCFGDKVPSAFIARAFEVPGRYSLLKFYRQMGFKPVKGDPHLLYLPVQEGFVFKPQKERYIPQDEDKGVALMFFEGGCPFCISFINRIETLIREVAPNLPLRTINKFEEQEELDKRGGQVPGVIINQTPIKSEFFDSENFQKEVREALGEISS